MTENSHEKLLFTWNVYFFLILFFGSTFTLAICRKHQHVHQITRTQIYRERNNVEQCIWCGCKMLNLAGTRPYSTVLHANHIFRRYFNFANNVLCFRQFIRVRARTSRKSKYNVSRVTVSRLAYIYTSKRTHIVNHPFSRDQKHIEQICTYCGLDTPMIILYCRSVGSVCSMQYACM